MKKNYFVYIITNNWHTVLYIGFTSNLLKRVWEHKNKVVDSFTSKYNLSKLVYFEIFEESMDAIKREKQLKKWNRAWKERLISQENPRWDDLYQSLL